MTALCAVVGRALSGLLGVGGGIVLVGLVLLLDEPQLQASATSLLAIVPVAVVRAPGASTATAT